MDTPFIQEKAMIQVTIALILLISCSTKHRTSDSFNSLNSIENIHMVSTEHFFSSRETKDRFVLTLNGKNALNGFVKFEIITLSGMTIYSASFESKALLGYGINATATEKEKINYLINRMENFFNEENFINPAIGSNEIYDSDYHGVIGESLWTEIKKKGIQSTGFYYLLWEGDQSWITFVDKDNKVIRYKTCC